MNSWDGKAELSASLLLSSLILQNSFNILVAQVTNASKHLFEPEI